MESKFKLLYMQQPLLLVVVVKKSYIYIYIYIYIYKLTKMMGEVNGTQYVSKIPIFFT